MRNTTIGIALAAALAALAGVPAAAQGLKLGVFDPQRVAQESIQGKQLQARLDEMQSKKQAELAARGQEIQTLEKQFGEQQLSLSTDRRSALQIDIERKKLELENARNLATQQLQLEFAGAQSKFQEMLLKGIASYGRGESFDVILDVGSVAWASETVDVTTAIIDRFDSLFPQGTEPPATTPANPPPK